MNQYVITPVLQRFEAKYIPEPNSGCWLWIGAVAGRGYGVLFGAPEGRRKGRQRYAHNISYELYKGPIPHGKVVRHTCDMPCCVYPQHLVIGTQRDNILDAFDRRRIHRGAKHPNAKISEADQAAILNDPRSSYQVAKDFNIQARQIRRIRKANQSCLSG